jgi:hypothetical protein
MELLDEAARLTAEGLHAEFCKVMEFERAQNRLIVPRESAGIQASSALPRLEPTLPLRRSSR